MTRRSKKPLGEQRPYFVQFQVIHEDEVDRGCVVRTFQVYALDRLGRIWVLARQRHQAARWERIEQGL